MTDTETRFSKFSEFPGREIHTRVSRDERKFYLEKLREKAKAGDSQAMAEIVELGSKNIGVSVQA